MTTRTTEFDERDLAVLLDSLLASVSPVGLPDVLPGTEVLRWAAALIKRPATTRHRLLSLASELGTIVAGTSTLSASTRDRRFHRRRMGAQSTSAPVPAGLPCGERDSTPAGRRRRARRTHGA